MTGALVVVGTPIGNLGDMSPRATEALTGADLICCEDTRRTGRLLAHLGITAERLKRVDEHTEYGACEEVVGLVRQGRTVAVVTDAGMPGVSDPGELLVAAVSEAGLRVTVVPGPSAVVSAVAGSGLPVGRFVFEGFLPRKGTERRDRLSSIAGDERPTVVYESPHRLAATIADLAAACGSARRAVVAREITKLHEEFARGTLAELVAWAEGPVKGEVVVVIEGAPEAEEATDEQIVAALSRELESGTSRRDAASAVADELSVRRRRVYQLALGVGSA